MKSSLALLMLVAFALGCGGTNTVKIDQMDVNDVQPPDWYLDTPQDDAVIRAVSTATSQDVQVAVDKATLACRGELASQLGVKLREIESMFEEETGFMQDAELSVTYKSAVNAVTEKSLPGSRVENKHLVREGDIWRAYVMMQLPMEGVREALRTEIGATPALNERLAETRTMKDLGDSR